MANAPVIWITRPEPGNGRSVAALRRLGYEAVAMPLTTTVAYETSPVHVADNSVVAVTSAAAIRHLPDWLRGAIADKPVFAVGEATAQTARDAGFSDVRVSGGDATQLAQMLVGAQCVSDATTVVYVAGVTRTGTLEQALDAAGLHHTVISVYKTQKVSYVTYVDAGFSVQAGPSGILFHSGLSVVQWLESFDISEIRQAFVNTKLFCISDRVASLFPPSWSDRVIVASAPEERSLFAALKTHLPID